MAGKSELDHFRNMLLALFKEGQQAFQTMSGSPSVLGAMQWFDDEYFLSKLLKEAKGDFGEKLIFLRPPTGMGKVVTALWASWDFEADPAHCKIEVLMRRAAKQVYGFRVDPPHSHEKHNFWHVQYTHRFTSANFFQSNATWIDDSTPAFPVIVSEAEDVTPKDAAAYATVAFYGRDMSDDLRTKLRNLVFSASLKSVLYSAQAA